MRGWSKNRPSAPGAPLAAAAAGRDATPRLLVVPQPWWLGEDERNAEVDASGAALPSDVELVAVRAYCETLYREQVALFRAHQMRTRKGDAFLHESVMKSGTLGDKMTAMAMQIRDYPFFHLAELASLVASAGKKGRREAELAAKHVVDLLCKGNAMPVTRLLKSLARRPVGGRSYETIKAVRARLLFWYFEDQLKIIFGRFVEAVDSATREGGLDYFKDQMIKVAFQLVSEVPEREKETLAIVINKAGDKDKRIASRVPYLLGLLVQRHSNMRAAVVAEVERFLYRPQPQPRAHYYLLLFLTQVGLTKADAALAKNLTQIYFSFFSKLLEVKAIGEDHLEARKLKKLKKRKKARLVKSVSSKIQHKKVLGSSKIDSKMLTALLTGVSRAFPFLAPEDRVLFDAQMDTFYRVVYAASFNKACHALALLLRIMVARKDVSDRFYEKLYGLMVHPDLGRSSKQALFLNVVYRAIAADTSVPRVRAFLKRLLQVALHEKPAFACAALIVVSEALRIHGDAQDAIRQAEPVRLVGSADDGDDKDDDDGDDEKPPAPLQAADVDDELEAERAHQLQQLAALLGGADEPDLVTTAAGKSDASGTAARRRPGGSGPSYNPLTPNPLKCHADLSCAWELTALREHHHPSVAQFAKQLLELTPIRYDGDPLLDFSLAAFLDRLAYKAPKQKGPRAAADHELKFQRKHASFSATQVPADSREFLDMPETQVREEEKFIHRYMKLKEAAEKGGVEDDGDDNGDGEGDDDFDVIGADGAANAADEAMLIAEYERGEGDFGDGLGAEGDEDDDDDDGGDGDDDALDAKLLGEDAVYGDDDDLDDLDDDDDDAYADMMESDGDDEDGDGAGALGALLSEAAADGVPVDGGNADDELEPEGARYRKSKKAAAAASKLVQKKRGRKF